VDDSAALHRFMAAL
ncbi:hypothetical protein Tco_0572052, partial [Tanacetum coccineum]